MANERGDQFDKKARREMEKPWVWNHARIAELLRSQHAAMVRLVEKARANYAIDDLPPWCVGNDEAQRVVMMAYEQACDDILASLAKQGKGGR